MSQTDELYEARWRQFEALDRMIDHWYWRPGWRVGRWFYTWHLTFGPDDPVRELASVYQDRISLPFLDPVPLEGLHLTIQGVGFADEVAAHDLAAIIRSASARFRDLSPFTLELGPADADEQGVPLAVRPGEPVAEIRHAIRSAIGSVWGESGVPEAADGFHSHVTLFYSNSVADPAPLRSLLTELRSTPPVTSTVSDVKLIRLNRDNKVYEWDTVATVPLGSA